MSGEEMIEIKLIGKLECDVCGFTLATGEYSISRSPGEIERLLTVRHHKKVKTEWDGHECLSCYLQESTKKLLKETK